MKPLFALIILMALFINESRGQNNNVFKIKPGEKVIEKIPTEDLYSYNEFIKGIVYRRDNTSASVKLNYNCYYSEMQFIDPKGDTLSLADEGTIKRIVIKSDTFYFSKNYVRSIADFGNVKLASRTYFNFSNRERLTGFGESSSGEVETYTTAATKNYLSELVAQEIITLTKKQVFYVGDRFNNFRIANRKSILDMYSNRQKEIQVYLKENKTNFNNEEDLRKLMKYFE